MLFRSIKLNCLFFLWWVNSTLLHELNQKAGKREIEIESTNKSKFTTEKDFEEEGIHMDNATTELNPKELGEVDELYVKANTYQLLLYLTQLERRIVSSAAVMPSDLKRMMRHVYKQVGTKFDVDSQFKSIGGFLILRALNPALCNPVPYAMTTEPPKESVKKELTNISRILQNLANETAPSDKKPFLAPFDGFVEQEIPKLRDFYRVVVGPEPSIVASQSVLEVPHEVEMDHLAIVWNFLYQNKEALIKADEDGEYKELFGKIAKLLDKK